METRLLGNTGLEVSRLCFGSLTVGPLQANLDVKVAGSLIVEAFERGVNFLDTADLYDNYPHIREALKSIPRDKYVISTKSYAWSRKTAEETFMRACRELGTDYIDLFMLHEQESEHTLRGHAEAMAYFLERKEKGDIRAFGISTHHIAGVEAAIKVPEIQVVHPIFNYAGLGIQDGNRDQMLDAIKRYKAVGGGVFAMKPLGGGNLIASVDTCFDYVLGIPEIDSIAVGMQRSSEIIANTSKFEGKTVSQEIKQTLQTVPRTLHIDSWCIGCGACAKKCQFGAIEIIDEKAIVNHKKCMLCGYCSSVCPEFCIKVV